MDVCHGTSGRLVKRPFLPQSPPPCAAVPRSCKASPPSHTGPISSSACRPHRRRRLPPPPDLPWQFLPLFFSFRDPTNEAGFTFQKWAHAQVDKIHDLTRDVGVNRWDNLGSNLKEKKWVSETKLKNILTQMWWYIPIMPVLRSLRWEDSEWG